jgi:hypothetical protein
MKIKITLLIYLLMSINRDASNNIMQQDFLAQNLLNILSNMGQPGDTFTIESTFLANLNEEDIPIDPTIQEMSRDAVPNNSSQYEENEDNSEIEDDGEETPLLVNDTIPPNPMQNIFNEMNQIFNIPANNHSIEFDPSSNDINNIYSTSAPTTQRERRRGINRRRSRMPFPMRRENIAFDADVNRDYQNFISGLFNINRLAHPGGNIGNILTQSLLDPSQNIYKNVISKEGEDAIVQLEYKDDEYSGQTSCPVTLCDFKDGDKIAKLPCGHIFSSEAILKWLQKEDARCPVCRKQLPSKEVKKDIKIQPINRRTVVPMNRRFTSRDFISHIVNSRLRREEDNELQRAIMASLRDSNPYTED